MKNAKLTFSFFPFQQDSLQKTSSYSVQIHGYPTYRPGKKQLPAELLSCHRLLNVPVTAAGCAALTDEDKAVLGKKKATAVVTPCANAKNSLKSAPIASTVKAGINVALGSDGAVEAGNLDMFEVMRQVAYGERVSQGDPSKLPAAAVLMMATVCGARAQGRAETAGMLKEGFDADIALVDLNMKGMGGIELIPKLNSIGKGVGSFCFSF